MTNNNNQYYIQKLPETSTIAYFDIETGQNLTVEEYQKLYPANSDIITTINKSGSNFGSEKEGYGPCNYSSCSYSCRFYLQISFDNKHWVFNEYLDGGGEWHDSILMKNIGDARDLLEKFQNETYKVEHRREKNGWSNSTIQSREKQREVMVKIENCIDSHERGNKVYEPLLKIYGEPELGRNSDGEPCIQC